MEDTEAALSFRFQTSPVLATVAICRMNQQVDDCSLWSFVFQIKINKYVKEKKKKERKNQIERYFSSMTLNTN